MQVVYTTSDGQTFEDKAAARAHERSLKPKKTKVRSTDALPQDLVERVLTEIDGMEARAVLTLSSHVRAKRKAAGLLLRKRKSA